jgi:hypothetical protein
MSNVTESDKTRDTLQKWLLDEGFKIQSVPHEKASFAIMATDNQGINIHVLQPIGKYDLTVILAGITVSKEQQLALQNKDNKERLRILWELRFGLLNTGLGFGGIAMPLERLEISTQIYHDGLTKNAFMDKLAQVKRAILFVFWTIDRELGEAKPKADSSSAYVE